MTRKGLISNGVIAGAMAALVVTLSGGAASAVSLEKFCEGYAHDAVAHTQQARANNCGFSSRNGSRWNKSTSVHRAVCMNMGEKEAAKVARLRDRAVKDCIANKSVGDWNSPTPKDKAKSSGAVGTIMPKPGILGTLR